ncbi:MAG: hypothetical protein Q9183_003970, partial [Haloplaca sp. 2 TL-2023]
DWLTRGSTLAGGPALGYNHLQASPTELQSDSSRGALSSGQKPQVDSASTSPQTSLFLEAPRRQVSRCEVPTKKGKVTPSSRQCIEVRIPYVPPYVPCRSRHESRSRKRAASQPTPSANGAIVSRYTTEEGKIGFVVIPGSNGDGDNAAEIEVDLANIYDYVTPAELERYEHHEWDLESERERQRKQRKIERQFKAAYIAEEPLANRPKRHLGRPRKRRSLAEEPLVNRPKRPPGRPRKRRSPAPDGPARFVAVHIPSPVKQPTRVSTSTSSTVPSDVAQPPASETIDTTPQPSTSVSSDEKGPHYGNIDKLINHLSDTANQFVAPTLNIDQLTPSNANRVIADAPSIADPSPSKGGRSYSMVQAAFSSSDSSTDEDTAHRSISEDELAVDVPTLSRPALHEKRGAMPVAAASTNLSSHQDSIVVQPQRSKEMPNGTLTSYSTPKRQANLRKSMTPHFPSTKKSIAPRTARSPTRRRGRDREDENVSTHILDQDRHQIQTLLGTRPPQPFNSKGAQDQSLGLRGGSSPMNENIDHASTNSLDIAPRPLLARGGKIVLGDPLNSSPEKPPRPSQPHIQRSSMSKPSSRYHTPKYSFSTENHITPGDPITLPSDNRTQSYTSHNTNPLLNSSPAEEPEITLGSPIISSPENPKRKPQPTGRQSQNSHSSSQSHKKRGRSPEKGEQETWYRIARR